MLKVLFGFIVLSSVLYANDNLLYKVVKDNKSLGYYEINYNKHKITTKSYGTSSKISYFTDKKISYIDGGLKNIKFKKNKSVSEFKIFTKISSMSSKIKDDYARKLKKVKDDTMLMILKNGKKSIELFNKRETKVLTLEELISNLQKGMKSDSFILFDKSGVMKMIAKLVKTDEGYDIINKQKDTKYMKVVIKKDKAVLVKSYVSSWYMELYGAGEYKLKSVDNGIIDNSIKQIIKSSTKQNIKVESIEKLKYKSKKYFVSYKVSLATNEIAQEKMKKYCIKAFKKIDKISKISYEKNICKGLLKTQIKKDIILKPILENLVKKHQQLKFTKQVKILKNGDIKYKILGKI